MKTSITDKDIRFMQECLAREIAVLLVEEHNLTIHQALDTLFSSQTYQKLTLPATGLFFQSPRYVFSILEDELKGIQFPLS